MGFSNREERPCCNCGIQKPNKQQFRFTGLGAGGDGEGEVREEIHGVQLVAGEARNALRLFGKYNELHKSLEYFVYVCVFAYKVFQ